MSAAQNYPSNFAASVANAGQSPVAITGKDSASTMPVKAGDASNNAAQAAPDADDAARMQRGLNLLFPGQYPEVPQGGAIYVFAVK